MGSLLRGVARVRGVSAIAARTRAWRHAAPLSFANFVAQRVIGLNRDTPWPVHFTSRVTCPGRLDVHPSVRESFAVSGGCYVQAINGILIGAGTVFAPGVKIISANHNPSCLDAFVPAPPIRVGERCWLGANSVVLPGVTLGDQTVVGAGAVVTQSFPGHCVVVGVPARLVRMLDPHDEPEPVRTSHPTV